MACYVHGSIQVPPQSSISHHDIPPLTSEIYPEPLDSTVCELQKAIAARSMSAAEVLAAFQARLEQTNPILSAVCTENERAVEEAAACDARLARGESARPLEGVPILIKDNIETAGLRTTYGSRINERYVPEADAVLVSRLRDAGAVILGKSNTPEYAADINTTNPLFGQTRNPWDLNTTSGGSSGGTGSAVAAGMAPAGIGTDLGGSIRLPSAFNGLVGLRPSPGRVPVFPQDFGWDTLIAHVQGPMARSVEDLARIFSVIAGPDERDPSTLPALPADFWRLSKSTSAERDGCRVAYAGDLGGVVPLDPEVRQLAEDAAGDLEQMGCAVEAVTFDASDVRTIIAGTRAFNLIGRHADRYDAHRDVMTPPLRNQIESALEFDLRAVTAAERLRTEYWHRVRVLLERFDFIVTPTVGVPAFRLDEPLPTSVGGQDVNHFYDVILTCYAFSITGLPALSVPCGFTASGLPVGLQIVGPRQREDLVLDLGARYLAHHPEHMRRPPPLDVSTLKPVSAALSAPGVPLHR